MKNLTLLLSLLFPLSQFLVAQSCVVNVDSLKGQYNGDCRKGKAEGHGEAKGTDSYVGDFKNGYPDGEGKYSWKNGAWYEGAWKNGLFDGKGTMHKEPDSKQDSGTVLTGFWKKGKYVGKYEKPYNVNTLTNNVSEVTVRKINSSSSEVIITVKSITGGGTSLTNAQLPKPMLVDVQLIQGRFEQQVSNENSSVITNQYIFRKVTFPFYAILTFETPGPEKLPVARIGVELYENCYWGIQVGIDN